MGKRRLLAGSGKARGASVRETTGAQTTCEDEPMAESLSPSEDAPEDNGTDKMVMPARSQHPPEIPTGAGQGLRPKTTRSQNLNPKPVGGAVPCGSSEADRHG